MFILTILEKIKEIRLEFSQESVTVLWIITNYQEARIELANTRLKKLKSTVKNKIGAIVKIKE